MLEIVLLCYHKIDASGSQNGITYPLHRMMTLNGFRGGTMKGSRPLANSEILLVAKQFYGVFAIRNRSLFMLGVSVGGRISEMLALTIGDVWQNGRPVLDLLFLRGIVKGKEASRMIPVNADGQRAILDLVTWHGHKFGDLVPDRALFPSRKGSGNVAMTRKTGHIVLKSAFEKAGLNGKLATHSLRKSFAQRAYDASGDIYLVQQLLGHKDVSTTREYLGVSYEKMKQTLLGATGGKLRYGAITPGGQMG